MLLVGHCLLVVFLSVYRTDVPVLHNGETFNGKTIRVIIGACGLAIPPEKSAQIRNICKLFRHRAGITDDSYLDECANDQVKMRELIRKIEHSVEHMTLAELEAVAVLFDLANEVNRTHSPEMASQLKALGGVLGLLERDPRQFLKGDGSIDAGEEQWIEQQIQARLQARKAKDFETADKIRGELLEKGIVLEDRPGGKTEWRRQ